MVSFRWLGAAGCEIRAGGKSILIDPFLSRPSKWEIMGGPLIPREKSIAEFAGSLEGLPEAIIAGHTHFDHAMDIPFLAECCKGPVLGSESLQILMELYGKGERAVLCEGNQRVRLSEGIAVTMIPSRHGKVFMGKVPYPGEIRRDATPPLAAKQYRLGRMFMPMLEIGGMTIIHAGSAGLIESELEGRRCDVLCMCVPGWKRVPAYTAALLHLLKPSVIVPFHFDDFTLSIGKGGEIQTLPFIGMEGFLERLASSAPEAAVRIPRPFEKIEF